MNTGGGGGCGYYGGGGGNWDGGGGGSSWSSGTITTNTQGYQSSNGYVTITVASCGSGYSLSSGSCVAQSTTAPSLAPSLVPTVIPSVARTLPPSSNPSSSPSSTPTASPTVSLWSFSNPLIGGNWILVRHVPAGNTWHPATDGLAGTSVYGSYKANLTASNAFSIQFSTLIFNEFLFATGDMQIWLRAPTSSVYGTYSGTQRQITCSSQSSTPYTAAWYNRGSGNPEDPWISTIDHTSAVTAGQIVHGENSFGGSQATNILPMHGGANVFIRWTGEKNSL